MIYCVIRWDIEVSREVTSQRTISVNLLRVVHGAVWAKASALTAFLQIRFVEVFKRWTHRLFDRLIGKALRLMLEAQLLLRVHKWWRRVVNASIWTDDCKITKSVKIHLASVTVALDGHYARLIICRQLAQACESHLLWQWHVKWTRLLLWIGLLSRCFSLGALSLTIVIDSSTFFALLTHMKLLFITVCLIF